MLKLNPILCKGVVRVGGRLSSAPVDFSLRHPVILPKESHFTDLVVRQYHESSGHSGYNGTLSSLHEMYWIERGSSAVKKVLILVLFVNDKRHLPVSNLCLICLQHVRRFMNLHFFIPGLIISAQFSLSKVGVELKDTDVSLHACLSERSIWK